MNKAKKGDRKSFFRHPAVITHLGEKDRELSKRRQDAWLARICRHDLKPERYATIRVCSDHFVTSRPAKLYDTTHQDWAPLLNLGYNAKISDSKVRDYTGLSCWQLLFILLEFIETDVMHCSNLTPFQQLLLTLMRL